MSLASRKSQSALEYMMTYGWAILIIVIVAAILYTMGIFNPAASSSQTVNGFGGFTATEYYCSNSLGLSVSLGNSLGYPIKVYNASIVSSSGLNPLNVTVANSPVTVLPGEQFAIKNSSGSPCPNSGSNFGLSLKVKFEYQGANYTSTGSISGLVSSSSASNIPSLPFAHYISITITNNQASPTPNPFQQNVTLNITKYSTYLAANLENVAFSWPNGTILPSWRENASSTTNKTALYWVKIPAMGKLGQSNDSLIIELGFFPTSANVLNTTNTGEAPQLSSTYGKYDDGAKVFNFYDNFSGTSLDSQWSTALASGLTYSVNNGLSVTQASVLVASIISSSYQVSPPVIAEFYGTIWQATNAMAIDMGVGTNNSCGSFIQSYNGAVFVQQQDYFSACGAGANSNSGTIVSSQNTGVWSVIVQSTTTSAGSLNYGPAVTPVSSYAPHYPEPIFVGNYNTGTFTTPETITWVRTRAYPPNDVMPSIAYGTLQ